MINLQIQWRCHSCRINGCVTKPELEENYTYYTFGGCVTISQLQICYRYVSELHIWCRNVSELQIWCRNVSELQILLICHSYKFGGLVTVVELVDVSQEQNQGMHHNYYTSGECVTITDLLQVCVRTSIFQIGASTFDVSVQLLIFFIMYHNLLSIWLNWLAYPSFEIY